MLLLYEFPSTYESIESNFTGAIDGAHWLTRDDIGKEGDVVPAGAVVHVRGWAPNLDISGPATHVVVEVDGTYTYQARVGSLRADVARHFENDAFALCGFEAIVTTGRLGPGPHEIVAYTVDPETRRYARLVGRTSITVAADWSTLPAPAAAGVGIGHIDEIVDESRGIEVIAVEGAVAIPRGSLVRLRGWYCDPVAKQQAKDVYAVVDGDRAYLGRYGALRPDVAATLATSVPNDLGFEVEVPTASLSRGAHSVEIVVATGDGTLVATPLNVQFIVGQSSSARIALTDMAPAYLDDVVRVERGVVRGAGAPLRLLRGDRLFVRGWAIDDVSQSVAAGVVIVIDDRIEVPALYGLPRPDVAEAHHNSAYHRSGFTGEIVTDTLPIGMHTAECRVLARDGRGAFATAQRFEFEVAEV